jgi:hypothetical protein
MIRLLLVTFFLEVGFVLVLIPWSAYWDRNYFAQSLPQVHALITNNFIRGAISGLGIVNLIVGIGELASIFLARHAQDPPLPIAPAHHSEE